MTATIKERSFREVHWKPNSGTRTQGGSLHKRIFTLCLLENKLHHVLLWAWETGMDTWVQVNPQWWQALRGASPPSLAPYFTLIPWRLLDMVIRLRKPGSHNKVSRIHSNPGSRFCNVIKAWFRISELAQWSASNQAFLILSLSLSHIHTHTHTFSLSLLSLSLSLYWITWQKVLVLIFHFLPAVLPTHLPLSGKINTHHFQSPSLPWHKEKPCLHRQSIYSWDKSSGASPFPFL